MKLALALSISENTPTAQAKIPKIENDPELFDWEENAKLTQRLKDTTRELNKSKKLCSELEQLLESLRQRQEEKPINGTTFKTDEHKRPRGKKLTTEERRAVLHCHDLCAQEKKAGKSVSTTDPIARTASYLGLGTRTISSKRRRYIQMRHSDKFKD
ncbi:hypothetical protein BGZ76_005206 [Entomortierella beljakovae]|nr:hypothetical protein BGZ76_005206 [Entomortierella beljakovae]